MISNIISKELCDSKDTIDLLWTNPESAYFTDFVREACKPCRLIDFDKTYYGNYNISIVICNNRLMYLEKCIELSRFFHAPLLIIDHFAKSDMVNEDYSVNIMFDPVYQIATSRDIFNSWNNIHNKIMPYNKDNKNMKLWKEMIFDLIKTTFIIKDEKHDTRNTENR
jgi:hypothetical protein